MKFPFARFEIEGESMLPAFQPGDRVLVRRFGNIRAGDIIIFYKNGMKFVKRVAVKNGRYFIVRGDNAPTGTDSSDFGEIAEQCIIGKVIMKY